VIKPAKIRAATETIYDVASLTKPLITTTLVLHAHADGLLDVDRPVSEYLREFKGTDKERVTFVDLLSHRAGFEAWYPLYSHGEGPDRYLEALVQRPLIYEPGTKEIYSDLGLITAHLTLMRVLGRAVDEVAREKILEPLGLQRSFFNPSEKLKGEIAATEMGNEHERRMTSERGVTFQFRDSMIWGETHDGNAHHMGGYAGNAGLFSTASDILEIARQYLIGGGKILPTELVKRSLQNYTPGLEENRGLGWQLRSPRETHPSSVFGENNFGHTGFTGTSAWVDPDRDLIVVLLTNRVHPTMKPFNMQLSRRDFHALILEDWKAA
jgi:CubicO group peptidase (beta-lactamase class C family)